MALPQTLIGILQGLGDQAERPVFRAAVEQLVGFREEILKQIVMAQ